jgi:hypothetical protein
MPSAEGFAASSARRRTAALSVISSAAFNGRRRASATRPAALSATRDACIGRHVQFCSAVSFFLADFFFQKRITLRRCDGFTQNVGRSGCCKSTEPLW